MNEAGKALATTDSSPFTVYSSKFFPGTTPISTLSEMFVQQGIRLPIRKKRSKAITIPNDGDGEQELDGEGEGDGDEDDTAELPSDIKN
ncbi:hypothetical protein HDU76_007816, partial [Blyttiomyces sp. JEL0837]